MPTERLQNPIIQNTVWIGISCVLMLLGLHALQFFLRQGGLVSLAMAALYGGLGGALLVTRYVLPKIRGGGDTPREPPP